ncbi:hypothetical protein yarpen_5 [Salmonella phage yarpen]|uniref:Uncharacterized protein n=1 Tax=Salmonella phage yarpen TaxID=2713327 RepID=A0A6G8RAI0_9CAUD|nr:hypothetical protein HWD19_gp05 [Salmonella phage yarpen]QIN98368.1 hypothetical protein yarpen_5 [Salmonella phage yarpen]
MSPVYNTSVTLSATVGDVNKTVTVGSTNPNLSGDDLLRLAKRALEDNEVTGTEGVSIEINIEGYEESISITTSDDETSEQLKFNDELEYRTGEMFSSALNWYLCKASNYADVPMSDRILADMSAREIAKGWAHVQMLQEHICKLESCNKDASELITAYKRQITDLQQLMGKRAEEYEAEIRSLNGTAVANNRAFSEERKALITQRDAEKRRADDLADRLNFIRKHMDGVI